MAKKTLEEKIGNIVKFFLIGTSTFIIISLLLLNDYSYDAHFDPKKVYDVIKDGFTLSAAFLAPVAAIILFSDWKEQYFQTKIEKDAQCIYDDVVNYLTLLHKLERLVQKNEINNADYQKVIDLRGDLRAKSEELQRKIVGFEAQLEYKSESGLSFYNKSKDIYRYLNNTASGVRTLVTGFEKEKNGEEYIQKTANFQEVLFSDIYDNLDELSEHIIFLTAYKSQVKAKSD